MLTRQMYDSVMDYTFDQMIEIARRRGNRSLVWAMEHGVFDEHDYNDRRLIRERIRDGR